MKSHGTVAAASGVLVAATLGSGLLMGQTRPQVAFPEGYRAWTHVKSEVILEGHVDYDAFGGIHHVYANDLALTALKEGTALPDGAVLVFDLFEERLEDDAVLEGARKVIGVMEKDLDRFRDTEG